MNDPIDEVGTYGGAREGSGPKTGATKKAADKDFVAFSAARARNEAAKAELNEHELKVKRREYISRDAVIQASATAMAATAQSLRSIEDRLENEGVPVDVCLKVGKIIDATLEDLAADMELMTGELDD